MSSYSPCVWWRRAVPPSLPWAVCFLSFFFELRLDARDGQVPSDGLLDRDVNLAALAKRGQVGRLVVLPLVLGHRHRARRAAARGGGGDLVPHRQHCGRDKVVALRRRAPLWPFLAGGGGEGGGGFGRVGGRLLGDVRELDQLA